jgi:trehalose 6-phosphate phosphatase
LNPFDNERQMSLELCAHHPPAPRTLTAHQIALFLDLDGTIAPIAARPQDVAPDPRRTRLLRQLRRTLGGRLAVVSGRTLAEIDRILEGAVPLAAAVHGLVRRDAHGRVLSVPGHPELARAERAFRWLADQHPGILVEPKGQSVTLHFRLAPDAAGPARDLARRLAARTGLVLMEGAMAVELRTPGPDKGDSVRAFLSEPPFLGARPVFVGDDVTDEDGFAAARELGGFGVKVGRGRATTAQFSLPDVDAVLRWLEGMKWDA